MHRSQSSSVFHSSPASIVLFPAEEIISREKCPSVSPVSLPPFSPSLPQSPSVCLQANVPCHPPPRSPPSSRSRSRGNGNGSSSSSSVLVPGFSRLFILLLRERAGDKTSTGVDMPADNSRALLSERESERARERERERERKHSLLREPRRKVTRWCGRPPRT